jgi:3-deoxy-D-arabino-heptulosonate 7-phosphate (DAHP) synthase
MEVHNNPSAALSDKATQLDVETARRVIREVMAIRIALAETFSEE